MLFNCVRWFAKEIIRLAIGAQRLCSVMSVDRRNGRYPAAFRVPRPREDETVSNKGRDRLMSADGGVY